MVIEPSSFKGGINPGHYKISAQKPITKASAPEKVYIPLQQHIGAPCTPLVEKGEEVKLGQKIGEGQGFVSAPVHATVSGKVIDITDYTHPLGTEVPTIIIENDGQDELHPDIKGNGELEDLSVDDLKNIIKEAGIVGMGGATFPTHVKLSPPDDKPIDTIIINGAECEPFLTSDHRTMVEHAEELVYGTKAIMKTVNCHNAYIGIEANKPDAIEKINELVKDDKNIEVAKLEVKYPQGAEKQLIETVTDRQVPSGGLPMDVGCIVSNTGTCVAIAKAIREGVPLYERVVTITGSGVEEPQNLLVRIGTLASEVIKECGGMTDNTKKVIMGGPMMGMSQPTTHFPVIKGTSGILLLTDKEVELPEEGPCISCGRCIDGCPISLLPNRIAEYSDHERYEDAEEYNALDCIECGCCTFICPAKRFLLHHIRLAKNQIMARRREEQK
ncbi:electron transport complex subunit RsxC [Natranaerofaba carboxydovora]|uniref:electron transport complex subunit RsxC n=1 Tax=Natranaerofaba carboxydovora TaxID=2742683 RepID=UPI001F13A47B|nr:electron transport complex subunit RsxC [Natranaerofaba carboxydovora]UMZ72845.1 Electron transport complex subunit RnfC [Natranaerofaba carboxydovora]